jgi:outer membrane lipoprotein-sorting protein
MLILPWDPAKEGAGLIDATDEDNALYIIFFTRIGPNGEFMGFSRAVWFDRIDLTIVRQIVYDDAGSQISDTRYSKWQSYGGVQFPAHIDINRDKDGYGVTLEVVEMQMNVTLPETDFVLNQPEGYQLRTVGDSK